MKLQAIMNWCPRCNTFGLLLVLALIFITESSISARAETVVIDNVFVEITAQSAVDARTRAIRKAEAIARSRLATDFYADLQSTATVKYFHIRDEKFAPGYYAAKFQFAFETEAFAVPGPAPRVGSSGREEDAFGSWILAVPIHFRDDSDVPLIWDPDDGWTRYWVMSRINQQVPVIANVADDQDRELLASYMDGDYASLLEILAGKYGAHAATFVILDRQPDAYDSSMARVIVDYWHPATGLLSAAVGFNHSDLVDNEIDDVAGLNALRIIQMLASDRMPPLRGANEVISVPINMAFDRQEEWHDAESRLRGIDGAELTNVQIRGNRVHGTIIYDGSYNDLVAIVSELGLLKRQKLASQ